MLIEVHTENDDLDLYTTAIAVLTATPDADFTLECRGYVVLGDGTKDLDGTGGNFEFTISVGGKIIQPSPQIIAFSTDDESGVFTLPFIVPAGEAVLLLVKSPNSADIDVDVTATLYDVSDTWINKNARGLVRDVGGDIHREIIFKPDGTTPIISKVALDKDGNNISPLEAGRIASEERSTV